MTVYFVSRHSGATAWAQQEGITVDQQLAHLNVNDIKTGDVVIGSLPVNLAADICQRGARYVHLTLELPFELRGKELNAEQMRACGARIEEYVVTRK